MMRVSENKTMRRISLFILSLALSGIISVAQTADLSNKPWKLWLDETARWVDDSLHLPPVTLSTLPVNPPTCGWEALYDGRGISINLPATIEEHFWGKNGNHYGVAGDYTGVSWFVSQIDIPETARGKRLVLKFESVQVRAEVFVNNRLAGYDIVAGTPFEVEITDFVRYGESNNLAIRITEPDGIFTWRDYLVQKWGKTDIAPRHGFGGITGKVFLETTDQVFFDQVFVKNKPEAQSVDLEISSINRTGKAIPGTLKIAVVHRRTGKQVYTRNEALTLPEGENMHKTSLTVAGAQLWSPDDPQLYELKLELEAGLERALKSEIFGFRWFEVKIVAGDRQFYLNGKRIVLRSAISWGFWPENGRYPTNEWAERQIRQAKAYGLNMLNFHRALGQPNSFRLADSLGLLIYEEPGGYGHGETPFVQEWNRQKLFRMVTRDRNHPSLIIYNFMNEAGRGPKPHELADMKRAHQLDGTRFITFSSQHYSKNNYGGKAPKTPSDYKTFVRPYDTTVYIQGWWDEHHAGGPGVWLSEYYKSPSDYYRFTDHKEEIIFWGEEGAIGAPARLERVKDEIGQKELTGWDSDDFLKQYQAYHNFLTQKGFNKAFPSVDHLTTSMGNVSHYYQGRVIENIRINNITDAYCINGWESNKIENHSGIVDVYRNPKGNTDLIAYYNQPLFVAVKARESVFELGDNTLVDFYLVNEKNIKGSHTLEVTVEDQAGQTSRENRKVNITGGHTYGQLLVEGITVKPRISGYTVVKATLRKGKTLVAEGRDTLFIVDLKGAASIPTVAVSDTSGKIRKTLESLGITNIRQYAPNVVPEEGVLIAHDCPPGFANRMDNIQQPIVNWLYRGNTLIIVSNQKEWAEFLKKKELIEYRGSEDAWILWYGGNYFVREHPLLKELPVNTAFNWEYQCFAHYDRQRFGLRLFGEECVAGIQAEHRAELYTGIGIIPVGKGRIIISTPDILGAIGTGKKSSAVAKKLLLNYLEYAAPK